MASLLQELSVLYNKTFYWKYFATSHGKGVVDGRAKSIVRSAVMSKRLTAPIVQTARDFAALVTELMPNTQVFFVEDSAIPRNEGACDNAFPIPGIMSMHLLKCDPKKDMWCSLNAQTTFTRVL